MWNRIRVLSQKEFTQMFRDARTRAIIFGFPLVQLIIFGYVVNTDVNNINFAVLDQDKTPASRELIRTFDASRYFTLVDDVADRGQLEYSLLAQKVSLTFHIPRGFAAALQGNAPSEVQILVDGSVSNISAVVASYAMSVAEDFSQHQTVERLRRVPSQIPGVRNINIPLDPGIDLRLRVWYNPNLESRSFYLPGVVAFLVMLICLLLTSMAVVREKELGTMEQLMVTPIRPLEMVLGKTLPFALVGTVDMVLVVSIAYFWFEIPIRGSLALLFLGALFFVGCALGIGLFISTVSDTMQQAVMTTFFILNPLFLLSGFAFPIEDMPVPIQYITYINPLRHFLVIVRGIFLKGTGFLLLWPQYLALAIIAVTVLTASMMRFRKRL